MQRRLVRALLALVLAAPLAACAGNSAGTRTASSTAAITRAEMDAVQVRDAYDLVQRLRPRWLVGRASRSVNLETQVLVFLNTSRLGDLEALRGLETAGIVSVEYMDALEATSKLGGIGSDHVAGAIVVHTGVTRDR